MKYTAHIISHSHWDREWYLPYEKHHMRLIDLMDNVLDKIKNDESFKFYNMDGHFLPIEDYLQVKPHRKEEVKNAVKSGKLRIGPWYVLQDAFLTSSELNVRNIQYGIKYCNEFGGYANIGYYPDTFGIYSQAAQILKKSGIDNIYFGRGVTPTGFNNQVSEDFTSSYSEMKVKSPNNTQVDGILFANWYSNGNEIPTDPVLAKSWWTDKLAQAKKFSKTNHLLFMNGCDHQPLQSDITKAIEIANSLFDEVEFIHSNLDDYYMAIKKDFSDEDITTIEGELKSQNTDGYYTLVNTASSRVYQKISNNIASDLLVNYVESLCTMLGNEYPHEKIDYSYRTLMKNHAHDSICGCSCDSVGRSVDMRFENSINISESIIEKQLNDFKKTGVNLNGDNLVTIFNPLPVNKLSHKIEIDLNKYYFKEHGYSEALSLAENEKLEDYTLQDSSGNILDTIILSRKLVNDYDLPDNEFRLPYYTNRLSLEVSIDLKPFSYTTLKLVKGKSLHNTNNKLENDKLKVDINKDGSLNILDKITNKSYINMNKIFDEGDIGNEYMFGRVKEDRIYTINEKDTEITYTSNKIFSIAILTSTIDIPISAENSLLDEKLRLREFHNRNSKRKEETIKTPIQLTYRLNIDGSLNVSVELKNMSSDHRMRVCFESNNTVEKINVDSIFDVVSRSSKVSKHWKNENNDQQLSKFISYNENDCDIIISTNGLNEYEVKDNKVLLTLFRSVSEMGDWGHFETPEAQMIDKKLKLDYSIIISENGVCDYERARHQFNDTIFTEVTKGTLNPSSTYINLEKSENVAITCLKKNFENEDILRIFSYGDGSFKTNKTLIETDLLEKNVIQKFSGNCNDREIITLKIGDK